MTPMQVCRSRPSAITSGLLDKWRLIPVLDEWDQLVESVRAFF